MAKLVCEICGGRLVMSGDGVLQCEACGSCYSKDWARSKVQEITGTVQVEGIATAENLLKRAREYFNIQDYPKAIDYCNRILDMNPDHIAAKELRSASISQIEKGKRQSAINQDIHLFQTYEAVVTNLLPFACEVQLTVSGRLAYIYPHEISDPPPERTADVLSAGDLVHVTILSDAPVRSQDVPHLEASLFPPESHIGYYLQCPSIDAMRELLTGMKFSIGMLTQAQREYNSTKKGRFPASWSSRKIEDHIERCELLLAKALHDNPDDCIEIPCTKISGKADVMVSAWKTEEMQIEAKRVWAMGQMPLKMLNDSREAFSFLRRLIEFTNPHHFSFDKYSKGIDLKENIGGDTEVVATLKFGEIVFAYGHLLSDGFRWIYLPHSIPDIETLKCWYANHKKNKCFAGRSSNFWASKNSTRYCLPMGCSINNPKCPLCNR